MVKKRRSNRKVHEVEEKKRGFSTWSLGKKIGVIAVSILFSTCDWWRSSGSCLCDQQGGQDGSPEARCE